jgi:hypothetical protein
MVTLLFAMECYPIKPFSCVYDLVVSTLIKEGIAPRSLLPSEFAESPLERIRKAYQWQMKMVPEANQQVLPASETLPSVAVRPKQGHGPKMSM